ncbi:Dpck [Drosophila busckii]|uniref:Dephospho-CoA kinase domain-containing protein n=1 Tax=Drosophila busckii TaxID=30019 RepID=A0A0M4EUB5_DROBS|nr:dephospho-CoA kinase [Drosophila busckii]ALC46655.1 Dpck [Drosophila busckii]
MFIVAVTGGIATGKSTVTKVFEQHGIPVVDADKIAREIVEPGEPCWKKIREVFGDEVLLPTKDLNRAVLGRLIFEDKELRGKLNQITHPAIHRKIYITVFKLFMAGHKWIVLDLPLLFETEILMDFMHKIITVSCDSNKQLERLLARNELSEAEARKRVESQMPLEKKCEKSHFVVDNNGTVEQTEAAVNLIYNMMQESNQHWYNRMFILGVILVAGFIFYFINYVFDVKSLSWRQ